MISQHLKRRSFQERRVGKSFRDDDLGELVKQVTHQTGRTGDGLTNCPLAEVVDPTPEIRIKGGFAKAPGINDPSAHGLWSDIDASLDRWIKEMTKKYAAARGEVPYRPPATLNRAL